MEEFEEGAISVVTAMKWIPRSFLLEKPISYELSKEEKLELEQRANEESGELQDEEQDGANAEEEEDDDDENEDLPLNQLRDMQLNEDKIEAEDDESDLGSDVEDHCFKPSDKVLVTATVEDEQASLEIHTYDLEAGSFFVHHDIALPSYPLCIEWLGVKGKELGWTETESQSFLAVGTFEPHIEIWSLDVLDALEPNAKLEGHKDAVMCLAWNSTHPHLLASGGGDNAIKIWDLQTLKCGRSFEDMHTDKIQSCAWNPAEPTVLLSGSFDKTVSVFDARDPAKVARYAVVETDVECVVWDPHMPALFGVSTEGGVVSFVDVRAGPSAPPLLSFQAHEKACSMLTPNYRVPGMYSTCSVDKVIKIWDLQADFETPVKAASTASKKKSKKISISLQAKEPVAEKKVKVGKLFTCQFAANVEEPTRENDDPFLLAAAGSKGSVALWHAGSDEEDDADKQIKQVFKDRVLQNPKFWHGQF